ncbi:hypothetical protein Forpi1262_v006237 [Fusarium oxysporum f. sp. raphani]|uniref:Uncharacterized protein n=1 Tax=Fusarium oxysporum f. sp. raphani TaxID=96318 RepID=A0A8J5Q298_FUSOX|nr:hypothetical protein Forpi1262_v006237 [Fusarium oxysporum f. sp. raphani]
MSCHSLLCLWKEGIGILIKPLDSLSLENIRIRNEPPNRRRLDLQRIDRHVALAYAFIYLPRHSVPVNGH